MKRSMLVAAFASLLMVMGSESFARTKKYKNPFSVYDKKIAEYQKKQSAGSKSGKSSGGKKKGKGGGAKLLKLDWGAKIAVQKKMRETKYSKLKKEYEEDCAKIEKSIAGKQAFIEKYPDKKKQIAQYTSLIEKYNTKLEELNQDFQDGVEVFYNDNPNSDGD